MSNLKDKVTGTAEELVSEVVGDLELAKIGRGSEKPKRGTNSRLESLDPLKGLHDLT
jgi:hypothetical protein